MHVEREELRDEKRREGDRRVTVFRVADRLYGLPLEQVREAVLMAALTAVPDAAPWHAGMLNLRGRAVPVIDMRRRLGHPAREPGLETPILIVESDAGAAGLIVDSLVGLVGVGLDDARAAADADGILRATAQVGEELVLILDLHGLLDAVPGGGVPA